MQVDKTSFAGGYKVIRSPGMNVPIIKSLKLIKGNLSKSNGRHRNCDQFGSRNKENSQQDGTDRTIKSSSTLEMRPPSVPAPPTML